MLIKTLNIILITILVAAEIGLAAKDHLRIEDHTVYEAPDLTAESGLDDYLLYALAANPGLHASYERWQADVQNISQAGAFPEPRLGYGYFLRQVETRVGPQVQRFGISQAFPWFGKLSLAESRAAATARASAYQFETDRLKLLQQVKTAYYDYWFLGRRIEITQENLDLLDQTEALLNNRYSTGNAGFSHLLKVQVEMGKLEDMLATLGDLKGAQEASLNALLGRHTDSPISFPVSLDTAQAIPSMETLRSEMIKHNPELAGLRELQSAAQNGVDLAGKKRWPDLMFGLDYIQTDESTMPDVADNGKDPIIASVSINLPLSFGKYDAAEKEAASKLGSLRNRELDMSLKLQAQLKRIVVDYDDWDRKIDLYGNTLVPKAEQMLESSISALATGGADALDILDAQRTLLNFQLELERSVAGRAKAAARIDELTGGALSPDRKPSINTGDDN